MRLTTWILSCVLVVLTGCASLPHDSGLEVRQVKPIGRQEPWQNRTIRRDAFSPDGVAIMYIRFPEPLPSYWQQELVDTARVYEVIEGDRKIPRTLEREVFRAGLIAENGAIQIYDAMVDRDGKGLIVLIPLSEVPNLPGKHPLILSSDGKWAMTSLGKRVVFPSGFDPKALPKDFFEVNRSPLLQVVKLNPMTNEHARVALFDQLAAWGYPFHWRDLNGRFLAQSRADLDGVLTFTSLDGVTDRLISCTGVKVDPLFLKMLPWVGAFYAYQVGSALIKEDCLK